MAANRGQNGIQQLLAAEQEAQHIVNAARNGNCTFYCFYSELFSYTLVVDIRMYHIFSYYMVLCNILMNYSICICLERTH